MQSWCIVLETASLLVLGRRCQPRQEGGGDGGGESGDDGGGESGDGGGGDCFLLILRLYGLPTTIIFLLFLAIWVFNNGGKY